MKPLHEWSVQELKAAAYDELTKLETCRTNVRLIQDEVRRREQDQGNVASSGGDADNKKKP